MNHEFSFNRYEVLLLLVALRYARANVVDVNEAFEDDAGERILGVDLTKGKRYIPELTDDSFEQLELSLQQRADLSQGE